MNFCPAMGLFFGNSNEKYGMQMHLKYLLGIEINISQTLSAYWD